MRQASWRRGSFAPKKGSVGLIVLGLQALGSCAAMSLRVPLSETCCEGEVVGGACSVRCAGGEESCAKARDGFRHFFLTPRVRFGFWRAFASAVRLETYSGLQEAQATFAGPPCRPKRGSLQAMYRWGKQTSLANPNCRSLRLQFCKHLEKGQRQIHFHLSLYSIFLITQK